MVLSVSLVDCQAAGIYPTLLRNIIGFLALLLCRARWASVFLRKGIWVTLLTRVLLLSKLTFPAPFF